MTNRNLAATKFQFTTGCNTFTDMPALCIHTIIQTLSCSHYSLLKHHTMCL